MLSYPIWVNEAPDDPAFQPTASTVLENLNLQRVERNMPGDLRIPGIIGGAGPGATAQLYLDVVNRCRQAGLQRRPPILIASLDIDLALEQQLLRDGSGIEGYFDSLQRSASALVAAGADFLAIPCNTMHVLLPELSRNLPIPVLSIVEAVACQLDQRGWRTAGLLATRMTVASNIYQEGLRDLGFQVVGLPTDLQVELEQKILAEIDQSRLMASFQLGKQIETWFQGQGAEVIIAGCTELKALMAYWYSTLPVIDSLDALGILVVQEMLLDQSQA